MFTTLQQHTRCARLHTHFKLDGITQVLATRSRRGLEVRQGKRRDRTGKRPEHSTASRRTKAGLGIHAYLTQLKGNIAKTSSVNAASGQVPDQLNHSPQAFYKGTAPVYTTATTINHFITWSSIRLLESPYSLPSSSVS